MFSSCFQGKSQLLLDPSGLQINS